MKCPQCQRESAADAESCQKCGTRLEVECLAASRLPRRLQRRPPRSSPCTLPNTSPNASSPPKTALEGGRKQGTRSLRRSERLDGGLLGGDRAGTASQTAEPCSLDGHSGAGYDAPLDARACSVRSGTAPGGDLRHPANGGVKGNEVTVLRIASIVMPRDGAATTILDANGPHVPPPSRQHAPRRRFLGEPTCSPASNVPLSLAERA